jgi:tRNA-dihydrouridine synthase
MIEEQRQAPRGRFDPEIVAVRKMRGLLPLYIKGVPGSAKARLALSRAESYEEVAEILGRLREEREPSADAVAR